MDQEALKLKAMYPEAIVFVKHGNTYKAFEKDAQTIYSVMMNKPIERLGNIAEVVIKEDFIYDIIVKLKNAGCKTAFAGIVRDNF